MNILKKLGFVDIFYIIAYIPVSIFFVHEVIDKGDFLIHWLGYILMWAIISGVTLAFWLCTCICRDIGYAIDAIEQILKKK